MSSGPPFAGRTAARGPQSGGPSPRTTHPSARSPRHRLSRRGRLLLWGIGIVVGLVLAGITAVAGVVGTVYATVGLPETLDLQPAVVLDRTGAELGTIEPQPNRRAVPLDEMPEHLREAVLAAEDDGFYRHGGVSVTGVLRAAVLNVWRGEVTQGGSTISQQYVKVLTTDTERTVMRKVREAVLASKLERRLSKDEILERYLNNAYFGRGAYGVEAAARAFYGKDAAELDPAESALIAGMLPAPTHYDPALNPARARQRYGYVVDRLDELGWGESSDYPSAVPETVERRPLEVGEAPYFLDSVRAELVDVLGGEEAIFTGGLTVTSTLNLGVQRAAEAAERDVLREVEGARGAIVALDPSTGEVRALVGGRGHATEPLNLATRAVRQPGSTFKVFGLAAWLDQGRSPEIRLPAPATWRRPDCIGGASECTVHNYGGRGYGSLTVRQATHRSVNTVYAQISNEVGHPAVARAAERAGIPGERLTPELESVLGSQEVTPLELAEAYNTFAAGGVHHPARTVVRVERDGEVVWEADDAGERVFDEDVALTVTDVLRGVVANGTGRAADIGRPQAGKTGTTSRFADAWYVGYTPHLTASVWLGRPEGNEAMPGNPAGGGFPAQAWAQFARTALEPVEPADFPPPGELDLREAPEPTQAPAPEPEPTEEPEPTPEPEPTEAPEPTPEPADDEPADEPISPPATPQPDAPPPLPSDSDDEPSDDGDGDTSSGGEDSGDDPASGSGDGTSQESDEEPSEPSDDEAGDS